MMLILLSYNTTAKTGFTDPLAIRCGTDGGIREGWEKRQLPKEIF